MPNKANRPYKANKANKKQPKEIVYAISFPYLWRDWNLESNSCWAEDWNRVKVAEDGFQAKFFHRVMFYGDIQLGSVQKEVEITKGFVKHSGINDATLRNVTVGNNCLIEKVGNYINNYTIGDELSHL